MPASPSISARPRCALPRLHVKDAAERKANTIAVLREALEAIGSGELDGGYRTLYIAAAIGHLAAGCYEAAATHADQAITPETVPLTTPSCSELLRGLDAVEGM